MRKQVYDSQVAGWSPTDKYQAINLNRVNNSHFARDEKTIEIRGIRPQKDAKEFLTLIEVIDGRLQFLKNQKTALALHLPPALGQAFVTAEMLERHLQYISDSGMSVKDYLQNFNLPPSAILLLGDAGYTRAGDLYCRKVWVH
jgi:hypothetical protein